MKRVYFSLGVACQALKSRQHINQSDYIVHRLSEDQRFIRRTVADPEWEGVVQGFKKGEDPE